MLPRMRPETAAPSCGAGVSPRRATAVMPWLARRGLADPDQSVQVAALGALARLGELSAADVEAALASGSVALRRRAVEAATAVRGRGSRSVLPVTVTAALGDPDPLVVVGAAWFLAERRHRPAVPALARLAAEHDDTRLSGGGGRRARGNR